MSKQSESKHSTPCDPKLDAILDSYFGIEGASIRSVLSMSARGSAPPTAMRRVDHGAVVRGFLVGLTPGEVEEVRSFYAWRGILARLNALVAAARREVRNRARRRPFRAGIAEIERKWREERKAPR